jgi:thiol-disulfide isomerase/thioredoxin
VAPGLIALLAALAAAVVIGVAWQRTNGRMRSAGVRGGGSRMARTRGGVPGGGVPGGVARVGVARVGDAPAAGAGPLMMTGAELGEQLGQRATLVQFSTAFCAPCRATRRILAEVAGMVDGVAHVEIDAESHLDLVRRLDIRRTPTVLVLGPDGRIAKRASGQPRKPDVIAALGQVGSTLLPTDQIGRDDSDSEPGRA